METRIMYLIGSACIVVLAILVYITVIDPEIFLKIFLWVHCNSISGSPWFNMDKCMAQV
jgi:hypothetical protein